MLGVIWWMYGGYAWLTNSVAPNSRLRRGLLLVGMGGFLAIAIAMPRGVRRGRLGVRRSATSWSTRCTPACSRWPAARACCGRCAAGSAWLNLTSAALVLVGGILTGPWRYGLWAAAFALQVAHAVPDPDRRLPARARALRRAARPGGDHRARRVDHRDRRRAGRATTLEPGSLAGGRAGAHGRLLHVLDLLRRRRRAGRARAGRHRRPAPPGAGGAARLRLRAHPDAVRHRRVRRRGQEDHRAPVR